MDDRLSVGLNDGEAGRRGGHTGRGGGGSVRVGHKRAIRYTFDKQRVAGACMKVMYVWM
jgi:hypothetical protein